MLFISPLRKAKARESAIPRMGWDRGGFTLVEMLVVTGLIAVMAALMGPALVGIKGGQDMTRTAYDIAGVLDQARAYAMANNTYVFVGIEEVDASRDSSVVPQVPGVGRVAMAVVASKDGTRDYDVCDTDLSAPAFIDPSGATVTTGTNLSAVSRLMIFPNSHLAATALPATGAMVRPAASTILCNGTSAVTQFAWPLGTAYNSGSAHYNFTTVINFDPQGVARIQTAGNTSAIGQYMEIGLEPSNGIAVSRSTPANVAAIQIDAMTGATRIYRP